MKNEKLDAILIALVVIQEKKPTLIKKFGYTNSFSSWKMYIQSLKTHYGIFPLIIIEGERARGVCRQATSTLIETNSLVDRNERFSWPLLSQKTNIRWVLKCQERYRNACTFSQRGLSTERRKEIVGWNCCRGTTEGEVSGQHTWLTLLH